MNEHYSLSVVFCAVDETFSLNNAFQKIQSYNLADEYLFVLSQDATEECKKTVQEIRNSKQCNYIIQKEKGLGNAIRDAINQVNGTHMLVWPADDGMVTSSFPEMVRLSKDNPRTIVKISRWLARNGFEGYGRNRKIINFISQQFFRKLFKSELTEFTNPVQIAPIDIYQNIKWEGTDFDFIPEMILKPLKIGCKFIEVPCENVPRKEGKTKSNFFKLAEYYPIIFKIYKMKNEDISGDKK